MKGVLETVSCAIISALLSATAVAAGPSYCAIGSGILLTEDGNDSVLHVFRSCAEGDTILVPIGQNGPDARLATICDFSKQIVASGWGAACVVGKQKAVKK